MSWFLLMAQPAGGGGNQNPMGIIIPVILVIGVFYFLLIRPQTKRSKQHRAMTQALKAGDSVITAGGIRGKVAAVDKDTVVIRVADNVKITFNKSAVSGVLKE